MDKEQAKLAVQKLIDKYEEVLRSGTKNKYTEEETKKGFIVPLFTALGWDMEDRNEVTAEEHISGDRVDYGFYIGNRVKFYLEAKPLKADLLREDYANQAVRYSWNKGVNWAVLTDFESIKVFYSQDIKKHLSDKLFFSIPYNEYIERFDQIWLLSKKAFQEDLIDKEAERVGKKLEKVSVTTLLYKDLNKARELFTEHLRIWNENIDPDLLDEGVQKLLNRLVFIRVAEDRKIEDPILRPLIRSWRGLKMEKDIPPLYKLMVDKFRELNKIYNSNLFSPHPFEKWNEDDNITEEVVNILYGKPGYYEYDFKIIPADVLGTVYENYLGYRQAKKSEGKNLKKRKEQGIYYTPVFIVDYIVRNTLVPILDKCTSLDDIKKIKVIDPACGSGSFLIKAVEVIHEYYKKFGQQDNVFTKIQILKNNIYGVDLDKRAVEIARLNLLIHILDRKTVLPSLSGNIKNGNSLISGTDEELKKYFGKGWRDKKPFNWEQEFPEVFKQGGFDVVVGNPPWGANLEDGEKSFYKSLFITGKGIVDTFALFIEKSIKLLKDNGKLGLVLPDIILLKNYPNVRKLILDNFLISLIYYTGMAFHGVNLDSVVMIFQKEKQEKTRNENSVLVFVNEEKSNIKQKVFAENKDYKFNLGFNSATLNLKEKLDLHSSKLGVLLEIHEGIHSGNIREKLFTDSQQSDKSKKLLFKGVEVSRYFENWAGKFVNYDRGIINKTAGEYANLGRGEYFSNKKILVRRTGDKIIATIDKDGYFVSNNFFVIYKNNPGDKVSLEFILAVLNSHIGTWYFLAIQPRKGKLFAEVKINHLAEIPIPKLNLSNHKDETKHQEIVDLVNHMIGLQKNIHTAEENSNEWVQLKSEIEKIDKLIDQKVYELYGLTEEEIKIVESL